MSLSPEYGGAQYLLSAALLKVGKPEAALVEVEKETDDGSRLVGLAIVNFALGNTREADMALQTLIDNHADDWGFSIAGVLAFLGDTDAAFDWIDKTIERGDSGSAWIIVNPLYTNLYDDPRWPKLLKRLGKSPAQLAAIKFEVNLPE